MEAFIIKLNSHGSHLGSRLHARDILSSLKVDLSESESVVVDFEGVKQTTLSFCTEIFDTLYNTNKVVETINENTFTKSVTDFCKNNIQKKNLEHA